MKISNNFFFFKKLLANVNTIIELIPRIGKYKLSKLKSISILSLEEKLDLISESKKIIIMSENHDIDKEKYPLVVNLKCTLEIINFFNELPELWKLNDLYLENVAEYLAIRRSQVMNVKLWDISIDSSKYVGIITREKFYPIIKY